MGKESFISSWSTWKDGGELLLFALKMGRFRSAEKDKTWAGSEEGQGCRGRDPSENMHLHSPGSLVKTKPIRAAT